MALKIVYHIINDGTSLLSLFGPLADWFAQYYSDLNENVVLNRDNDILLDLFRKRLGLFVDDPNNPRTVRTRATNIKIRVQLDENPDTYVQASQKEMIIHISMTLALVSVASSGNNPDSDVSKRQMLFLVIKILHEVAHLLSSTFHIYCETILKVQHPKLRKVNRPESSSSSSSSSSMNPNFVKPVSIGTIYSGSKRYGDCGSAFEDIHCDGRVLLDERAPEDDPFSMALNVVAFNGTSYRTIDDGQIHDFHNIWNPPGDNHQESWDLLLGNPFPQASIQNTATLIMGLKHHLHKRTRPVKRKMSALKNPNRRKVKKSSYAFGGEDESSEDEHLPIEPIAPFDGTTYDPRSFTLGRKN